MLVYGLRGPVLRANLILGDDSWGDVVARVTGPADSFSGWLMAIDDKPLPPEVLEGWLEPSNGGPAIAVRLRTNRAGHANIYGRAARERVSS